MSVVALGLLPGLRARIQEWKNGIATVERQRRESEELVARLAKSAGEIKSSPFATYPEYLPDQ